MQSNIDSIRERLGELADELGELALARLRDAIELGETKDELERRLTRARRAVEKAAYLLSDSNYEE